MLKPSFFGAFEAELDRSSPAFCILVESSFRGVGHPG